MNTENLSTLVIHKLTQDQYNRVIEEGEIDENALYLTPDEMTDAPQPDWNQNDETAQDFIKNRTHYDYEGVEELLPTTSVTIRDNGSAGYYTDSPFERVPLIVGDTYIVTYDNVEYNVVAYVDGVFTCIGNPGGFTTSNRWGDGEIPFLYAVRDEDDGSTLCGTATTHTIAIKHQGIISTTIPNRYISKEIARTSKTLANKNPSGTGSFSLNRQSKTSVGIQSVAMGSNTTASGRASYAEGYFTVAASNYQHSQGKYNIEDSSNTYAHIVGNGTLNTARSNAHTLDWQGNAWFQGDVYVGSTSGTNKDEGSKKLITKEEVPQSDWNQNDESAPDYVKNRPFGEMTGLVTLYEGTYTTTEDNITVATNIVSINHTDFYENRPYYVSFDGQEYICSVQEGDQCFYIGSDFLFDETYPFYLEVSFRGTSSLKLHTAGTHSIKIEYEGTTIKQLDEQYIPDSVKPLVVHAYLGTEYDENGYEIGEVIRFDSDFVLADIHGAYKNGQQVMLDFGGNIYQLRRSQSQDDVDYTILFGTTVQSIQGTDVIYNDYVTVYGTQANMMSEFGSVRSQNAIKGTPGQFVVIGDNGNVTTTAASDALTHLGAAPAYTYGTTDLTAGTSPLATGTLYFVYESGLDHNKPQD